MDRAAPLAGHLRIVLEYTGDVEDIDVDITEQLAQATYTDLDLALDVYELLLRSARRSWRLSEVVRGGYDILGAALNSGRPDLFEQANRLVDEVASWGFLDLRSSVQAASASVRGEDKAQGRS